MTLMCNVMKTKISIKLLMETLISIKLLCFCLVQACTNFFGLIYKHSLIFLELEFEKWVINKVLKSKLLHSYKL